MNSRSKAVIAIATVAVCVGVVGVGTQGVGAERPGGSASEVEAVPANEPPAGWDAVGSVGGQFVGYSLECPDGDCVISLGDGFHGEAVYELPDEGSRLMGYGIRGESGFVPLTLAMEPGAVADLESCWNKMFGLTRISEISDRCSSLMQRQGYDFAWLARQLEKANID